MDLRDGFSRSRPGPPAVQRTDDRAEFSILGSEFRPVLYRSSLSGSRGCRSRVVARVSGTMVRPIEVWTVGPTRRWGSMAVDYEQAHKVVRDSLQSEWRWGTFCLDDRHIVE